MSKTNQKETQNVILENKNQVKTTESISDEMVDSMPFDEPTSSSSKSSSTTPTEELHDNTDVDSLINELEIP